MKKTISIFLLLALLTALFAGCAKPAETPDTPQNEDEQSDQNTENQNNESNDNGDTEQEVYLIGSPQPLTGTNANAGEDGVNAVELAVKQLNEKGGLLDGKYKIEVVFYDDQGSAEEAVKVATKMVEVDHVNASIDSCISGCILAGGGILNDNKIVTFGCGTSPTWMQQGWEYVFRACQNGDFAFPTLVNYWDKLGLENIAIIAGKDDANSSAGATVQRLCGEAGINVTTSESYTEGDTDFSGQCLQMINSGAEAIFIATHASTQALVVKQLRQYGFDGLCFTKELIQADSLAIAGDAGNYVGFAYPYLTYATVEECDVPLVKEFLEAYYAEYGVLPNTDAAYRAYDSVMILATAIEMAGSIDSDAVRDAINSITDYEGLGGTFDYSLGDNEGLHTCAVYVVVDGKYVLFDDWIANGGYDAWLKR